MTDDPPPWDAGLQNERTGLAWQRTMLSGLTCGLVTARLLAAVSTTLAVVVGLLALTTTAAFGGLALRRFRHTAESLQDGRLLGDGRPAALAATLLAVSGAGAAAYVLLA